MVRLSTPLLVEPAGWEWCACISVAVNTASSGAGRGGAGGSAWFVRECGREEERETTLQTWLRRLPVEEDRVRRGVLLLLSTPGVFLDTGVGVGIPLPVSGAGEWLRSIELSGAKPDRVAAAFAYPIEARAFVSFQPRAFTILETALHCMQNRVFYQKKVIKNPDNY